MIEILFSGGFDSTFMLCYLAKTQSEDIQPYYLQINRNVRDYEENAVKTIIPILQNKKDLIAKIRPLIFIQPNNFVDEDIESSWQKYKGDPYKIGGQQKFLAQFAKEHNGICWGQERYLKTPGHMTRLLLEKGNWKFTPEGTGYFTKDDCDPDVFTLFGNLQCPVAKFSNLMMWEKIKEWGYEDVFSHIHFCYFPINGKPCGMCHTCRVKIKQEMEFLFDEEGLLRNTAYKIIEQLDGFEENNLGIFFMAYVSEDFQKKHMSSYKSAWLKETFEKNMMKYAPVFDKVIKIVF